MKRGVLPQIDPIDIEKNNNKQLYNNKLDERAG